MSGRRRYDYDYDDEVKERQPRASCLGKIILAIIISGVLVFVLLLCLFLFGALTTALPAKEKAYIINNYDCKADSMGAISCKVKGEHLSAYWRR